LQITARSCAVPNSSFQLRDARTRVQKQHAHSADPISWILESHDAAKYEPTWPLFPTFWRRPQMDSIWADLLQLHNDATNRACDRGERNRSSICKWNVGDLQADQVSRLLARAYLGAGFLPRLFVSLSIRVLQVGRVFCHRFHGARTAGNGKWVFKRCRKQQIGLECMEVHNSTRSHTVYATRHDVNVNGVVQLGFVRSKGVLV
jgi:hypothetical protein